LAGLSAENFAQGIFGRGMFDLVARNPGMGGTDLKVTLTSSGGLIVEPSVESSLNDNLSDVQPRNHVYVRAGATNLALSFPLATSAFADGFHELTAVAYEGSHVRTQTKTTIPVVVRNSSLNATMTLLDLGTTNSVQGVYHLQVIANTNRVSSIELF